MEKIFLTSLNKVRGTLVHAVQRIFTAALKGITYSDRGKYSFTHNKIHLNSFDEGTLDSNLLH